MGILDVSYRKLAAHSYQPSAFVNWVSAGSPEELLRAEG
jgi:hypothetical protein